MTVPVLAFMTKVLVTMQLLRVSIALSAMPSARSSSIRQERGSAFLSLIDPQDDLDRFNDDALSIRKKQDSLTLQCKVTQLKDKETLNSLHRQLRVISGQLAGNVAQQSSAKVEVDRGKTDTTKLKAQLVHVTAMCDSQKKHLDASVEMLKNDKGRANSLRALSSKCSFAVLKTTPITSPVSALSQPSLLQGCGDKVVAPLYAAGKPLEEEARNFSTASAKQAFADALHHASTGSAFPVLLARDESWPSKSNSRSASKAKNANACKMPQEVISCGLLTGQLEALAKRFSDQKDSAVANQRKHVEECMDKVKQLNDRIKASDAQHARSSVDLIHHTGIKSDLAASRASIVQRIERTERDAKELQATCKSGIDEYEGELQDILKKRQKVANKVAGERVAIQDCETTEWLFSRCSKSCRKSNETAGSLKATRDVVQIAGKHGVACPQLSAELPCNDKPCPTDCAVAEWVKWSECSKACGGGTTKRTRKVVSQATDGGRTCPMLEQRKSCNVGRCSDECKLKEWTIWTACTRRCKFSTSSASGKQHRVRDVLGNPIKRGGGSPCPSADDKTRFEARDCNEAICPKDMTCDASRDVVFLLDASGDAGVGFDHQRSVVSSIAKKSSEKLRIGIVSYGKEVKILTRITANRTQLASISAYTPPVGGSRDTAKGEVVGRTLFADPGIGRGSQKVVVLLLGGAPSGFVEAKKAAEELRSTGVRIVVGLIDDGNQLARQQACGLVDAPCSANVEAVKSWSQIAQEPERFLAAVCP
jgi:hypothetical protein